MRNSVENSFAFQEKDFNLFSNSTGANSSRLLFEIVALNNKIYFNTKKNAPKHLMTSKVLFLLHYKGGFLKQKRAQVWFFLFVLYSYSQTTRCTSNLFSDYSNKPQNPKQQETHFFKTFFLFLSTCSSFHSTVQIHTDD